MASPHLTNHLASFSELDKNFMLQAIELARQGEKQGEVPVAAIVVNEEQQITAQAHNQPIRLHDPTAHAEIIALRQAGKTSQNYRLTNQTMYVTLEPCAMCATALVHARIKRLVFGAFDSQRGACGSAINILSEPYHNHQVVCQGGLLAKTCEKMLHDFFKKRR